jgi:thymidine phosphorylase
VGEAVGPDRPLAVVHARREADAARAVEVVRAAFDVGDAPAAPVPVVHGRFEETPA